MYEGCIANSNEWSGFWARYAETVTYDACVSTGNGSAGFWMDFVANCAFKGVIAVGNAKEDRSMKDVPAASGARELRLHCWGHSGLETRSGRTSGDKRHTKCQESGHEQGKVAFEPRGVVLLQRAWISGCLTRAAVPLQSR